MWLVGNIHHRQNFWYIFCKSYCSHFSNMWPVIRGWTGGLDFFWKLKIWACREPPLPHSSIYFPLLGHTNLPIRKNVRKVLGLLNVMILKRRNEHIFFQSNKFTVYNIKNKEDSNVFCDIQSTEDYPFQDKKPLRIQWNLNCNPQQY